MPYYLTFSIRIPAALADFFSSIAFVTVTKDQNTGVGEYNHRVPATPCEDKASAGAAREQQLDTILDNITNISTMLKDIKFPCQGSAASGKHTAKSERPTQKVIPQESSPAVSASAGQQLTSPLFGKLPPEIRNIIYSHVLVSSTSIDAAHACKFLGDDKVKWRDRKNAGMLGSDDAKPINDIDSTILQTCRRAYEEGITVLYGENTYVFSRYYDMFFFKCFSNRGIKSTAKSSQTPNQRLGLIRKALFRIELCTINMNQPFDAWYMFIASELSWPNEFIHFTALENLEIEILDTMKVKEDERVNKLINMFITKIATFGKLKSLRVSGIRHRPTLEKMKQELVREDGVFESADFANMVVGEEGEEWESW